MPQIDPERLAWLETVSLGEGNHVGPEEGCCLLEAASYLAGEEFSDRPECVSPVIAAFGRAWNDGLPDDETRDRILKPLLVGMLGTRTTPEDEEVRAWLAADWLARVCAPAWLRLSPNLVDRAEALEQMEPLTSSEIAKAAQPALADARRASPAARAAAWVAAGDAAGDAARDVLRPTAEVLQASAQDLLRRMCAVGRGS